MLLGGGAKQTEAFASDTGVEGVTIQRPAEEKVQEKCVCLKGLWRDPSRDPGHPQRTSGRSV